MANWKEMIEEEVKRRGDELVACTLSDGELTDEFDDDYGIPEGTPFTAWGVKFVYFPVTYDGREWVGSVPRDPCPKPTRHVGGY